MNRECPLAVLPANTEDHRVQVVLIHQADGTSRIALRQQTWAGGIGWFDQQSLELEPAQVAMLRTVLGASGIPATVSRPAPAPKSASHMRLVHVESA